MRAWAQRFGWLGASVILGLGCTLLGCAVLGCTGQAPVQGWELRFDDATEALRSRHLRAWIAEDCASATHLFDAPVPQDGTPAAMRPPELAPGRWAFGAESLDVDCAIHARGCVELDVPTDGDVVVIPLAATAPEPCVGACPCAPRSDGGARDAGPGCTVEVDGGGICPDGFASCGTDTSCRTFTPISYRVDRGGSATDGCLSLYCATTHTIADPGCSCGTGCYACLRDADGALTARVDEACGDPTLGDPVPSGVNGCSVAERGATSVSCCVLR